MFWLRQFILLFAITACAANDGRMRIDGASYPNLPPNDGASFFESGYIPSLKIVLGKAEYEALQKEPRKYVSCTVIEGNGMTYNNVAVHLKAGAGSFRQVTDRPAMTLNFDKYVKQQRFHGLDEIHLNNSVQDGTLCQEFLASFLFHAAGLPIARVSHARVELNERMLGVYVLIEGIDTAFLQYHFGNGLGTLYDGSFREITDDNMAKRTRDKTDYSDLKALKAALEEKDPVKRRQRLEAVLNVDKFLSFMALEAMVCHWDGYCASCNNYRVYHDPTTDKLVFIAHGMDQIIGDPNFPLLLGRGWVARALTETPEDKRAYFLRVQQLRKTVYRDDVLTNAVLQVGARIRPVFDAIDPNGSKNHAGAVADLCRRIVDRGMGIDRQLFANLGLPWEPKPLGNWQSRVASGNPAFDEPKDGDKPCLRIRVTDKNAVTASWRTHVAVPPGKYVFQGRVRTVDVPPSNDPAQGAAFRISGGQRQTAITGSTEWRKLEYEFSTVEGVTDVELVCELRADRGEAWFDTGSLTLTRKEGNK